MLTQTNFQEGIALKIYICTIEEESNMIWFLFYTNHIMSQHLNHFQPLPYPHLNNPSCLVLLLFFSFLFYRAKNLQLYFLNILKKIVFNYTIWYFRIKLSYFVNSPGFGVRTWSTSLTNFSVHNFVVSHRFWSKSSCPSNSVFSDVPNFSSVNYNINRNFIF